MAVHNERGIKGEAIAAKYLSGNGYRIIHRNWRYRKKEIDIIAREGGKLVIVEVKLRSTGYFGDPSEWVTLKKQRYLVEAAEAYVDTLDEEPEVRFDIISIVDDLTEPEIELIQDAFIP
jgi:putative endonuclease